MSMRDINAQILHLSYGMVCLAAYRQGWHVRLTHGACLTVLHPCAHAEPAVSTRM